MNTSAVRWMVLGAVSAIAAGVMLGAGLESGFAAQPGGSAAVLSDTPIISADGTARVERTPDYVDVVIGITADEAGAAPAQARAGQVMGAAIDAIKKLALADAELQTGTVELSPRYERVERERARIVGYEATMSLRVRTSDLEASARVIDAALAAGCNRVEEVRFGIHEALAAREEAVRLATKAARRKAEVMAYALELRLGRVAHATTSAGFGGGRMFSNVAQSVGRGGDGGEPGDSPVVPGKVEIWATANVSFTAVTP